MKRLLIAMAGFLAVGVSGLPLIVSAPAPVLVSSAQAAETERAATFDVPGMTCALCPVTVRKAMEGVEGVRQVEVDFDARTATVVFDPSMTTIETIAAASTNAGYPAAVKD
ncbi:heavy-metal-associated domain-containing protein [Mesorhizobium xinjiangense]|uniref:heavy-metal-associated domain-containing protein n=1 Tax=Mesorhizobium xinjiangense TaxID=2678685 RepID=UPI0012ED6781|nr:cation transporter [Mesorhizobium xinjiangense]